MCFVFALEMMQVTVVKKAVTPSGGLVTPKIVKEKHFPQPVEIIPKIDHTERPAQQRRNTVAASTVKRKDFETVVIRQVAEQYASAGVHDKREQLSEELLPHLTYDPGLEYLETWGPDSHGEGCCQRGR